MIVNPSASQIDDKSYAPLVMVKNGVVTHLFSDGLINTDIIKKLQLPVARYDYTLKIYYYYTNSDGSLRTGNFTCFHISRMQTSIELLSTVYGDVAFIEAELITKEI